MGRQAGTGLFLHVFVQKPSLKRGSATEWPAAFLFGCRQGPSRPVDTAADGEVSSCKWFSLSLQNAPSSESGSCQLHSVPSSDPALRGVSGVRGPICCQNRPVTSQAELAGFATRPRLVMGGSVTQSSRDTFHMVHPTLRLTPSVARPAGSAVGSSCLNYSRAQRETQAWNLSRGGRLRGSHTCWSGRLCPSQA